MTETNPSLTQFLLARLSEQESAARTMLEPWYESRTRNVTEIAAGFDPARVLADVEAKRRIVELSWHHLGDDDYAWGMEEAKREILVLLAQPYAAHPDYREEWRQ